MCRKFGWHILSLSYAFRAFISFLFTSFLLRISVQVSELSKFVRQPRRYSAPTCMFGVTFQNRFATKYCP